MNSRSRALASMLCALPLLASCAANSPPVQDDDAATDKTPVEDVGEDTPKVDSSIDVAPDVVADTQDASEDIAPDAPVDVAPDITPDVPVDVAPDVPADIAPDTSCRTRCSGFCTDPDTDVHNCGLCGNDCTLRAGVDGTRVTCAAGRCVFTGACLPGRANCSGNPDDGCEAVVTTAARCGACTNMCSGGAPNCVPMASSPGGYACSSGCTGAGQMRCGTSCVDTTSDPLNCGACGNVCPTGLRGTPACVMGRSTAPRATATATGSPPTAARRSLRTTSRTADAAETSVRPAPARRPSARRACAPSPARRGRATATATRPTGARPTCAPR